ncbi:hypothetical protein Efla_007414 [Eimeria flavescens]
MWNFRKQSEISRLAEGPSGRAAGDTKKEMDGLLPPDAEIRFFLRRRAKETVVIDAANRLYVGKVESSKCFQEFSRKLKAEMGSEAKTVDFSQPEAAARD